MLIFIFLFQSKKDQLLISYLAFIKHSIDKGMIPQPQLIADLKDDVVLITNKGRKKPSKEVIHFNAQYKNQWNLSRMFPSKTILIQKDNIVDNINMCLTKYIVYRC